jgi:hypothetical protein
MHGRPQTFFQGRAKFSRVGQKHTFLVGQGWQGLPLVLPCGRPCLHSHVDIHASPIIASIIYLRVKNQAANQLPIHANKIIILIFLIMKATILDTPGIIQTSYVPYNVP